MGEFTSHYILRTFKGTSKYILVIVDCSIEYVQLEYIASCVGVVFSYIFHCYIILNFHHFVKTFLNRNCKILHKFTSGPRPRNLDANLPQSSTKLPQLSPELRQLGAKPHRYAQLGEI